MNSIARAINNVAISLTRIATAIETKGVVQISKGRINFGFDNQTPISKKNPSSNEHYSPDPNAKQVTYINKDSEQIALTTTETSNPNYDKVTLKVDKRIGSIDRAFVSVPVKEKQAVDLVYAALMRAENSSQYTQLLSDIKANWFSLWKALDEIKTARTAPHRHTHESHNIWTNAAKNIWKS